MSEEPVRKDYVQPYGGTNVQTMVLPQSDKIAILEKAIADADWYLTKYTMLRSQFVDEINEIMNG